MLKRKVIKKISAALYFKKLKYNYYYKTFLKKIIKHKFFVYSNFISKYKIFSSFLYLKFKSYFVYSFIILKFKIINKYENFSNFLKNCLKIFFIYKKNFCKPIKNLKLLYSTWYLNKMKSFNYYLAKRLKLKKQNSKYPQKSKIKLSTILKNHFNTQLKSFTTNKKNEIKK